MAILESAIFWIVVAAASEIIALTPLKSNSVIQLVLNALNSIKPAKKISAELRPELCRYPAEDEFHKAQPKPEVQWDTIEVGEFGKDGWSISTTFKPSNTDD